MSPTLEMDTPTRPTSRLRGVRIVAHLRRQVKGDRQPRLPLGEEVVEPPIRLGRRSEPGILPHGPEARPVHRWLDPPRVGILPGEAQVGEGSRNLRGRPAWPDGEPARPRRSRARRARASARPRAASAPAPSAPRRHPARAGRVGRRDRGGASGGGLTAAGSRVSGKVLVALRREGLERGDEPATRLSGLDDVVDVAPLRRHVGVGELLPETRRRAPRGSAPDRPSPPARGGRGC